MRTIHVNKIVEAVAELCIEANTFLAADIKEGITSASEKEVSPIGSAIFQNIEDNLNLAINKKIPICQDTGMAVVFVTIGQEVTIHGGSLSDAINDGVRKGYAEGYLRKSVVDDPLKRKNTDDNAPAVIHYDIVEGDRLHLLVMTKGFGSENTSALAMLKPSDGEEGVKKFILSTIEKGAPNACPPIVVGVGIGGTFEKAALMAKEVLKLPLSQKNPDPYYADMEADLIKRANQMGIGPMGLGGINTVLGLHIATYPTHIAGLPVAINICCYLNRHGEREL